MIDLFEEFQGLVSGMEDEHVDYALIGALAVAVWGAPRATTDIDLLVREADLRSAESVADRRGFTLCAAPMSFRDGTRVVRRSKVQQGELLTLDLILVDPHLEAAWDSRLRLASEHGSLWVVSRQALIDMKVAANRPQDVFDVERLKDLDR